MNFETTTQTIAWFKDRYLEGTLEIRPPYQRKPVWAERQKCYLVESILMDLPIPEIYVQSVTSGEGKTTYAIVDGQQRMRAIFQFIGAEIDANEAGHNKFILDKLPTTSKWVNSSFADLPDVDKKRFYGYQFAVRFLKVEDELIVRDVFKRLNQNLSPLKPQELRNATFMGPFMVLATTLAEDEYWAENRIMSPPSIRRMGDIEFVSELLIGVLHGPQGGGSVEIDEFYRQYEDYDDEFPGQKKALRLYNGSLTIIQDALHEIKETRWSNKTDFYSLFIAVAHMSDGDKLTGSHLTKFRHSLQGLAMEIDAKIKSNSKKVSEAATMYAAAVQKGVNDKKRRADRHAALLLTLMEYFN